MWRWAGSLGHERYEGGEVKMIKIQYVCVLILQDEYIVLLYCKYILLKNKCDMQNLKKKKWQESRNGDN